MTETRWGPVSFLLAALAVVGYLLAFAIAAPIALALSPFIWAGRALSHTRRGRSITGTDLLEHSERCRQCRNDID